MRDLQAQSPRPKHKAFKAYEPGYLHVDVKYLPQMADETSRRYLFVAIDRATRWVFMRICNSRTAANAGRAPRAIARQRGQPWRIPPALACTSASCSRILSGAVPPLPQRRAMAARGFRMSSGIAVSRDKSRKLIRRQIAQFTPRILTGAHHMARHLMRLMKGRALRGELRCDLGCKSETICRLRLDPRSRLRALYVQGRSSQAGSPLSRR